MGQEVQVRQSATFRRAYKRLQTNQKADVDDAVSEIVLNPLIGVDKKGDLAGVFVYKFKYWRHVLAMKSKISSEYTQQLSQPTKQVISSALEPLTRSEIDALRQKKKRLSDYYQKVIKERVAGK